MNAAPPLRWQTATIEKIVPQTPRVSSFFLKLSEPFTTKAGQHVDVRLTAPDGYQAQRGYSMAQAPESGPDRIELCIEELEGGEVSPFFHMVAAAGDEIELRGPLGGHFIWRIDDPGPILLIGGGSGIVPLMSMARHRAASGVPVPMAMLYSARNWSEVIFRDELLELNGKRDGFDCVFTLTRDVEKRDGVHARRIDSAMVMETLMRLPALPAHVYICGSNAFVGAASGAVMAAGVAEGAIRTERYGG
ncbi:oxidoreductase [Terrihabitans soli]|uniref:Oxidoreductase n=1 Tax=Terrihabitans soli TaxID=708113 RepID=A0A6S6QUH3_9HYPH|nr:ferredoxin reductase [Terrihabitans soli]BCJ90731.1 oxidoreductase [Terrihabitans soli]